MTDQMVLKTQQWLNRTYRSKAGFGSVVEDGYTAHPNAGWVLKPPVSSRQRAM